MKPLVSKNIDNNKNKDVKWKQQQQQKFSSTNKKKLKSKMKLTKPYYIYYNIIKSGKTKLDNK